MAIFDSKKTTYLTFYIVLKDPLLVEQYKAQYPDGVNRAPEAAAVEFSAPWQGYAVPTIAPPFSYTVWRGDDADNPFPHDVATFQRHTGGFFGFGGTTIRYYWMGQFVYEAPHTPGEGGGPSTVNATTKRRFVEGFEHPCVDPATGVNLTFLSTDASRHAGGRGLAIRGFTNQATRRNVGTFDSSFTGNVTKSWERFYIRLRKKPSTSVPFWRTHGYNSSDGIGQVLGITATGSIAIYTSDAANTFTFLGTVPDVQLEEWDGHPATNSWHRIDILIEVGATPQFSIYFDGELKSSSVGAIAGPGSSRHTGSSMGCPNTTTSDLYMDVDDWMGANQPTTFDGQDWLAGSKIVRVVPRVFTGSHSANWTGGDVRGLAQTTDVSVAPLLVLNSSTSGALAEATLNDVALVNGDAGSAGVAAVLVEMTGKKTIAAADGQIGYKIAGGAAVDTGVTQTSVIGTQGVIFSAQAGASAPLPDVTPLTLRFLKGADANSTQLYSLIAQVEMVGRWGAEDYTPDERTDLGDAVPTDQRSMGAHNYPYPLSPWAERGLAPPISPYVVIGGTYTGNGTGRDLTFPAPVHFLFIRPTSANSGGTWWLAPSLGSHKSLVRQVSPFITQAEEDPDFIPTGGEDAQQSQYRVRISGGDSQSNQAAIDYQYIAVCDPGMRFLLTGSIINKTAVGARTEPLVIPDYTAEFAVLIAETPASDSTKALYGKSANQSAAGTLSFFGAGAALTDALTLGTAGALVVGNNLYAILNPHSSTFMLWRRDDGSGDTGLPAVVALGQYTGDGTASRTVNIAPASGKRPLFAMVFSENGSGYWRDPSHTGTNSSQNTGTENANGLTAGQIDGFSVGSSLNANLVVYSWFALMAGTTACNNGWGCNGTYVPVEPVHPGGGGGGWPEVPPEPVPEPDGETPPGGGFAGGPPINPPDFSTACYAWSTYLANIALSRIGISHQITDIRTEVSEEAYKSRLIFAMTVEAVLRDHPWPFATRYANLSLVDGAEDDPVNDDWTYSYRQPVDMVTARRIVGQDGQKRAYDGTPPQFRLGSDATGYLIYTNAVATADRPVQLEYTTRMSCPSQQGDPLFRDALAWKLAASLALTIARDNKKAADCEGMYRDVLRAAKEVAANEAQPDPSANAGDAPWITGR